jgi:hypothetical protein
LIQEKNVVLDLKAWDKLVVNPDANDFIEQHIDDFCTHFLHWKITLTLKYCFIRKSFTKSQHNPSSYGDGIDSYNFTGKSSRTK